jgi:HAD superfamily hydrolase (TIGR01509 family)
MIKAVIFDLDGTLVQTEPMKALSHARAAVELSPRALSEDEVVAASSDLYGIAEFETAAALVQRFGLEPAARARQAEFGAETPLQTFLALQKSAYRQMLQDPEAIRRTVLPHAMAVLLEVRGNGLKIGLATLSYRDQVQTVLGALGLLSAFDVIATQDDVVRGKPDPEIFQFAARGLGMRPDSCLVLEDSLAGVQAALAAGMWCIAVPNHLTREAVHMARVLDEQWIVENGSQLMAVVQGMLAERSAEKQPVPGCLT